MEGIEELRADLDEIDRKILRLINERMSIARKIGLLKKKHNIPIIDREREEKVYKNAIGHASRLSLDPSRIRSIFHEIIALSTQVQYEVINEK